MGISLPWTASFQEILRAVASGNSLQRAKQGRPTSRNRVVVKEKGRPSAVRVDSERVKPQRMMDSGRVPLCQVVSDCVKRWFEDTLKEARAGDIAMQVLVGQMYCSGYGVNKDEQKGRAWINKASKRRSSAWLVSNKRPGYNASDSDSDEPKSDNK